MTPPINFKDSYKEIQKNLNSSNISDLKLTKDDVDNNIWSSIGTKYDTDDVGDTLYGKNNELDIMEIGHLVKNYDTLTGDDKKNAETLLTKFFNKVNEALNPDKQADTPAAAPAPTTDKTWGLDLNSQNLIKNEDGSYSLKIEDWTSADKKNAGVDDCLSRIIANHYGVKPYGKEGKEIMAQIMELNGIKDPNNAGGTIKLPMGSAAPVVKDNPQTGGEEEVPATDAPAADVPAAGANQPVEEFHYEHGSSYYTSTTVDGNKTTVVYMDSSKKPTSQTITTIDGNKTTTEYKNGDGTELTSKTEKIKLEGKGIQTINYDSTGTNKVSESKTNKNGLLIEDIDYKNNKKTTIEWSNADETNYAGARTITRTENGQPKEIEVLDKDNKTTSKKTFENNGDGTYKVTTTENEVTTVKNKCDAKGNEIVVTPAVEEAPVDTVDYSAISDRLYNATAGKSGTDEDVVNHILLNSNYTSEQLVKIMQQYQSNYGRSLMEDIQNDFSGDGETKLRNKLFEALQNEVNAKTDYDTAPSATASARAGELHSKFNEFSMLDYMGQIMDNNQMSQKDRVEMLTAYTQVYGNNLMNKITDKSWFGAEDGYIRTIFDSYMAVLGGTTK